MVSAVREFVLLDGARALGDDLPLADAAPFTIAGAGRSRTVRRTWLDTFDWRLYRAGLTLELLAGRGVTELVLTGRDGELAAADPAPGGLRLPCLVDHLPFGPLRERLAPVAGVRALLPVAKGTSVLTDRRALNSDDKTIAIVTFDAMTASGSHADVPVRVAIRPLRGYQPQADRLADALAGAPGVAVAAHSPFETALAAAGRKAGDYSSKINVELTADMPAALAVVVVLRRLFDTAQANVAGTIGDVDTEFLHDLRIAVRRTRSVLKLAGSVLPGRVVVGYRPEFKWLGDLTTPTRDLDVYLLGYESMASTLIAGTEQELRPFHDYLARQRATAQRALARGLRSARYTSLAARWRAELEQVARAAAGKPAAGKFAAGRIARAHRRVLHDGAAIGPASPPAALHDLRKRCKELRYLLEVFASLHGQAEQWRAINELKALQDCLGEFQDADVQFAELRAFAERMMAGGEAPAPTLLAMGEIGAGLALRQRAARGEFADRFAEFSSPRGQARIEALTKAAP